MIQGKVRGYDPKVDVDVLDADGNAHSIHAVDDTGFTGSLSLPKAAVDALGITCDDCRYGTLSDGSRITIETFVAIVEWHGREVRVVGSQLEGGALIGMELLEGGRLTIDAVDGGAVRIDELSEVQT